MNTPTAYLIDDDEAMRDALAWLLRSRNVSSRTWASAESFLTDYSEQMRGCLVLDIRMQGMSGIELYDILRDKACQMPTIFLTGHGDVPLAVSALKKGAFDFIEKPFDANDLADRIIDALNIDAARVASSSSHTNIEEKLGQLTSREREVMEQVLHGKLNKVIADELNIAMRTVEVHRARVFEKMGVRSAVELAQLMSKKP